MIPLSSTPPGETAIEPKRVTRCPLCGADNACVPARTGEFGTPCWCFTATIDPDALARVPDALRGEACLCPCCAGVGTAPAG